jgi:hypothetical protein
MKTYPVYNLNRSKIGMAASASEAGELLSIDSFTWDDSINPIRVNFSNIASQFAWTDSRLATESLIPL